MKTKPADWPDNVRWTKNTKIVAIVETIPPFYILENGKEVKGKFLKSRKSQHLHKSKKKHKSRNKIQNKKKSRRRKSIS